MMYENPANEFFFKVARPIHDSPSLLGKSRETLLLLIDYLRFNYVLSLLSSIVSVTSSTFLCTQSLDNT